MIVMRCTAKLLRRLKVKPAEASSTSTSSLGDWYATLLHTRHGQFVVAMAQRTLLPIIVTGRDIQSFPARVAKTLSEVLTAYGVAASVVERECAALANVQYARTKNRSDVGVLTDYQRSLPYHLDDGTLTDISLRLAQTPIVARDVFPDIATSELFGVARVRRTFRNPSPP